jgi:hypothetical protein
MRRFWPHLAADSALDQLAHVFIPALASEARLFHSGRTNLLPSGHSLAARFRVGRRGAQWRSGVAETRLKGLLGRKATHHSLARKRRAD